MEYRLILDILGAMVLAATFVLCLRSFRREDRERAVPLRDDSVARQSLAELLNLMDESAGRTVRVASPGPMSAPGAGARRSDFMRDRRSAAVFDRPVSAASLDVLDDGIEVTVRVNKQRASAAAMPVGASDVVNAVWEPVTQEIHHVGRLIASLPAR